MWVQIPFLSPQVFLDTDHCTPITSGPTLEEMWEFEGEFEDINPPIIPLGTPGGVLDIVVERGFRHPNVPDTWWLRGVDPRNNWESYILFSPECLTRSCMCNISEVIDLH